MGCGVSRGVCEVCVVSNMGPRFVVCDYLKGQSSEILIPFFDIY